MVFDSNLSSGKDLQNALDELRRLLSSINEKLHGVGSHGASGSLLRMYRTKVTEIEQGLRDPANDSAAGYYPVCPHEVERSMAVFATEWKTHGNRAGWPMACISPSSYSVFRCVALDHDHFN